MEGARIARSLKNSVSELKAHFQELKLDADIARKAKTQIATLEAQLSHEPDPVIVHQAGKTLRNITEGVIAGLIATAAQPAVWMGIHEAMTALFPG